MTPTYMLIIHCKWKKFYICIAALSPLSSSLCATFFPQALLILFLSGGGSQLLALVVEHVKASDGSAYIRRLSYECTCWLTCSASGCTSADAPVKGFAAAVEDDDEKVCGREGRG